MSLHTRMKSSIPKQEQQKISHRGFMFAELGYRQAQLCCNGGDGLASYADLLARLALLHATERLPVYEAKRCQALPNVQRSITHVHSHCCAR